MKRLILSAGLALAFVVPGVAQAATPTKQHVRQYVHAYQAVRSELGAKEAGCNLLGGRGSCHMQATDADVVKSLEVLKRDLAPAPAAVATNSGTYSGPQASYVPASSSTVGQSVATNSRTYSGGGSSGGSSDGYCGAYQFDQQTWSSIGMSGSPCGAPPAVQDAAAQKLYQQRGTQPWPHCGSRLASGGWAAVRQCENSGSYN